MQTLGTFPPIGMGQWNTLAARLGRHPDELLADAVRTEYVRIPLGGSLPDAAQPVVAFGAAAG